MLKMFTRYKSLYPTATQTLGTMTMYGAGITANAWMTDRALQSKTDEDTAETLKQCLEPGWCRISPNSKHRP